MKKSKVLAISLSAVALTTVVAATPLITTSCSNEENYTDIKVVDNLFNPIVSSPNKDEEHIDETIINVLCENNSAVIYTEKAENKYVRISVKTLAKNVFSETELTKHKIPSDSFVKWTMKDWDECTTNNEKDKSQSFEKSNLTNDSKFVLVGETSNNLKFKIDITIKLEAKTNF